jgi:predicted TIM-barrel fold metal-dependent hydrolase
VYPNLKQIMRLLSLGLGFPMLLLAARAVPAGAQTRPPMTFEEYEPRSTLVVPAHPKTRAKFPFIDVHGHQPLNPSPAALDQLIREMDQLNMRVMVNLSGRQGDALAGGVRTYARHPGRVVIFANLNFTGLDEPGWGDRAAAQLERDVKEGGAVGLKLFKPLGMDLKDGTGRRVPTDDARLDPVWKKAGDLGIPVLIHTAEPPAFFTPIDKYNERWLELTQFPARARPPEQYPPFDSLLAEQHRMFGKHRNTRFIAAHLDWLGADLGRLGRLLDSLPNVYTEVAAVLYELGRQPRAARDFLIRYQDRVMMGKDIYEPSEYHTYFRVFETADEYFDYYRKRHAFWKMYGLDLPDEVLKKIYYKNALKVIPGIPKAGFPQ